MTERCDEGCFLVVTSWNSQICFEMHENIDVACLIWTISTVSLTVHDETTEWDTDCRCIYLSLRTGWSEIFFLKKSWWENVRVTKICFYDCLIALYYCQTAASSSAHYLILQHVVIGLPGFRLIVDLAEGWTEEAEWMGKLLFSWAPF